MLHGKIKQALQKAFDQIEEDSKTKPLNSLRLNGNQESIDWSFMNESQKIETIKGWYA